MSSPPLATAGLRRAKKQGVEKASRPSWTMHLNSAPLQDDCKEYVPLSQYVSPIDRFSYVSMLEDTMVPPSSTGKKIKNLQGNIESLNVPMAEPSQVHTSLGTNKGAGVGIQSQAHASTDKGARVGSQSQAHASTDKGARVGTQSSDGDKGTKGTKRLRAAAVTWDDTTTHTLIKVYEEQWTHIKKGNFRTKDWEDMTYALNKDIDGSFNLEQVRNTIDTLKKVHKKELLKQNSTSATPSTCQVFNMCDDLWEKTPKCVGIAGAFDSDGHRPSSSTADAPFDLDGMEGVSTSPYPQGPQVDSTDLDGVFSKKCTMDDWDFLFAMMTLLQEHVVMLATPPHVRMRDAFMGNDFFILLFTYAWLCCGVVEALESVTWRDCSTLCFMEISTVSSRTIFELFGLGESTIRKYTTIICRILASEAFFPKYGISVPKEEHLVRIMTGYEAIIGLPHIAGALDGSHIRLQRKPTGDLYPAQFICRHGFPSILLQGIMDSNKLFWSVVCSAAGGVHDSTHFKECSLYAQLKRKEALGQPSIQIQGEMIKPFVIADSAYKARTFLAKPYRLRIGQFLQEKRAFDRKLSKGRVKVKNAFGLLKNRWKLLRELNVSLPFAPTIVTACCLLHNFVQLRGEVELQDQRNPHPNSQDPIPNEGRNAQSHEMALRVRAALLSIALWEMQM
ncbi:hypothetical protein L7F22_001995 [Adiantum nelumboides]|nr:hypothetical protein [Adiantum nelumboides]